VKRILFSIFCVTGLLFPAACNSDGIVKSDIGNITKDEFYEEMKKNVGENVLENMIVLKVLEEEFGVSEDEENDMMDELSSNPEFQMMLMQSGISFEDEDRIRSIARNMVLEDKLQFDGLEATEDEIEEKYQEMIDEHLLEIRASHILVAADDEDEDAKDLKEAKAIIDEVKEKLDDGGNFEDLAQEYSDDTSADNGGDLGYFGAGRMVPEFEEAAFSLEEDEISDIVQTEHGYHIIKVTHIPTLEEAKEDVERHVLEGKIDQEAVMDKFQSLMREAKIDIQIEEFERLQESLKFEEPDIDLPEQPDNFPENDQNDDEGNDNENNEENNDTNNEE